MYPEPSNGININLLFQTARRTCDPLAFMAFALRRGLHQQALPGPSIEVPGPSSEVPGPSSEVLSGGWPTVWIQQLSGSQSLLEISGRFGWQDPLLSGEMIQLGSYRGSPSPSIFTGNRNLKRELPNPSRETPELGGVGRVRWRTSPNPALKLKGFWVQTLRTPKRWPQGF